MSESIWLLARCISLCLEKIDGWDWTRKKNVALKTAIWQRKKPILEKPVTSWVNCLWLLGSRTRSAMFFHTCYWTSIEAGLTRFFLKRVDLKIGELIPCVVMVTGGYLFRFEAQFSRYLCVTIDVLKQGPRWPLESFERIYLFVTWNSVCGNFELSRMWLVERLSD